jgi:hypothetical protein
MDKFPDYAALASPAPLSVVDVQALLGPAEVLVLFLDTPVWKPTPEETFIWVVTKGEMRWVKSELGTKAPIEHVAALRCGLDAALWDDERAAARCRDLVKGAPERDAFDTSAPRLCRLIPIAPMLSIRRCLGRSRTQSKTSTFSSCRPAR